MNNNTNNTNGFNNSMNDANNTNNFDNGMSNTSDSGYEANNLYSSNNMNNDANRNDYNANINEDLNNNMNSNNYSQNNNIHSDEHNETTSKKTLSQYEIIYKKAKEFKRKYPLTISFRLRAHSKAAAKFIGTDEEIKYVFVAQKNYSSHEFANTNIVVLTNKRILVITKRLVFGYFYKSITIDMFNDLTIKEGIIWGKVLIDTVKEVVILSNIDKRALPEIEQSVSNVMLEQKAAIFAESRIYN